MAQATAGPVDQLREVVATTWTFLFGSIFRFLILLGIVLNLLGIFVVEDIVAGHLALYGMTALVVGVVGYAIVLWRLQDEY